MILKPNSRLKGVPHVAMTKEYLTCLKGEVTVFTAGDSYHVKVGDVLAFPGDQPHSYFNRGRSEAVALSVVALAL